MNDGTPSFLNAMIHIFLILWMYLIFNNVTSKNVLRNIERTFAESRDTDSCEQGSSNRLQANPVQAQ